MSSTDTLAYNFKPAGHSAPQQEREYAEPDRHLMKVFEQWLEKTAPEYDFFNEVKRDYSKVLKMLDGIEAGIPEAHSLFLAYRTHPCIREAGIFLSAVYNRSSVKDIVFDLDSDVPPNYLAYGLAEGKRFINLARAGGGLGSESSATVVNLGETSWYMCRKSSGTVINVGKTGNGMGVFASGMLINLGEAGMNLGRQAPGAIINTGKCGNDIGEYSGSCLIVNLGKEGEVSPDAQAKKVIYRDMCKQIPDLKAYLQQLKSAFTSASDDYRKVFAILDELGPEPGKKIEDDIKGILRRSGYDV